jgi:hypothetical protein
MYTSGWLNKSEIGVDYRFTCNSTSSVPIANDIKRIYQSGYGLSKPRIGLQGPPIIHGSSFGSSLKFIVSELSRYDEMRTH